MSLLAPIPKFELPPSGACSSRAAWFEIQAQDLPLWNEVLLGGDSCLYQYPFWNEPYRPLYLTPRYLAWGTQDRPLAYVCILTVGLPPAKIGLVFRGPVCLQRGGKIPRPALAQLLNRARSEDYMFIRVTHSDPEVLSEIARAVSSRDLDAFPYFLDCSILSPDYVVEQDESEDETLAGFDREVRRKIRRAIEGIRIPLRRCSRRAGPVLASLPGVFAAQALPPGTATFGLYAHDAPGLTSQLRPRLFCATERASCGQHAGGSRFVIGALHSGGVRSLAPQVGGVSALAFDARHVPDGSAPLQPGARTGNAGAVQAAVLAAQGGLSWPSDSRVERRLVSILVEGGLSRSEVTQTAAAKCGLLRSPLDHL